MESSYWVPAGLDYQKYTSIMDLVKQLGYNTIRLPFSNQLVETNPIVTDKIAANPQFRGVHALDVMDAIVTYAQKIGLKIILDDHRSSAATPKRVNYLDEPLWYVPGYPESSWIADWQSLARHYLHNDAVIGFDLRNEPHTDGPGPWDLHAYLTQGATWGPYHGVDNPATDWRLAAERAGNAILAINPHLLMFVEGVQLYADDQAPDGADVYWWGSILTPVRQYPVVLNVPHQLVYSPHDWGPWKWDMPWLRHPTYDSIQREWNHEWSFILTDLPPQEQAPIWLGEFGTCTNNPQCVDAQKEGNQAEWFHLLLRYLSDHPEIGWSFFALNGTNSNDHLANNGLLNGHWDGVANAALQKDLQSIQP
jgi:endoglucanase